jgi:hypothetical protein
MRRSDPFSKVVPRWVTILLPALPSGGTTATLALLYLLNGRIQLFNLSPKDSFLVAAIGTILVFTVLGLLIYCIALMRALRRALRS